MDYTLLDAAPDAVVVFDEQGWIEYANPHAEQLFLFARGSLVGVALESLVPPQYHAGFVNRRREYFALATGQRPRARLQMYVQRSDHTKVPVEISFGPVDTPNGLRVISVIRDITDQRKAEAKFRGLLESAPDAMVIADASGRIVLVNAQAERLLGYDRAEMLNQPVEMLIPHRFRSGHVQHRDRYVETARPRPMGAGAELYALRKDGTEIPVEISLSPLKTAEGMLVASAIRDITERKLAEAERARLIEERAAHADASRIKDEFLATLSHELRTPLNAILGWTTMLKNDALDKERARHALGTIERNARAQAQLVEDLLDLSRIITGKLHLELGPVDLTQVVDAAADVVRPAAQVKRIQLDVIAEERPILLLGDPDRLQQAVWNLLSNAVKFTPEGGRIEARIRPADSTATITVRDTGTGIDPAFLPHVFDRFRQQDSSSTRAHGGLGLGLAIVRSIVEAHGGRVDAFSQGAGTGATFSMTLPLVETLERRREPERSALDAEGQLAGIRVLVVDDAPDERDLFNAMLCRYGATVAVAPGVAETMEMVDEFLPDVIVSDIAMPLEDGYILLRKLRAHPDPRISAIPAVAVTAHARVEDRRRAIDAGFCRYVSKPVDSGQLVRAVAAAGAKSAVDVRSPRP